MTSEKLYSRVPVQKGHSHFSDTIQSFPGLQTGPTFEQKQKYLRDTIRYQLMTTTPQQAKRIVELRRCFNFDKKIDIQFCLSQKVPGTSLKQAAIQLGLRKK